MPFVEGVPGKVFSRLACADGPYSIILPPASLRVPQNQIV